MTEYETVGVIDADAASALGTDEETIIIEHDDPSERLLAQPKGGDDGE